MKRDPVIVIHGGAGSRGLSGEKYDLYVSSLCRVLDDVYPRLKRGASALKAAIRAAELLEDDPLFNAGRGSKIQRDGHIRMSASLMDGYAGRFASCVNVERLKNPIRLTELLLKEDDRVLAGKGAELFAREHGLKFGSPFTKHAREHFRARAKGNSGTIGAVVLDGKGRLAAATSTGGRGFEFPNRVSDSPTIAGNYANQHCAVSATGIGERIIEFAAAAKICTLVEAGQSLDRSAGTLIKNARRAGASFGVIALDKRGHYFTETASENMIWAAASQRGLEVFAETL